MLTQFQRIRQHELRQSNKFSLLALCQLCLRPSALIFLYIACIAAAMMGPIASETAIPNLGDYFMHLNGIIQAKLALAEGQFPLRVMPLEYDGWRYPYYQFYSPTTYTFAGLIHYWLTPDNPLIAFKVTIWCALVAGGIYLYRLAYWLCHSQPAALLGALVFLTAPYYIILIDHLASLNEIAALALTPAAVYYTLRRYYAPQNHSLLILSAFFWYLIITTHIVTFAYTSLMTAVLLLIITLRNRQWHQLLRAAIAYAFGCLLACWFLGPAVMLGKYLALSNTYNQPEHLIAYHPQLSELFSPAANLTEGFKSSAFLTIHPALGLPILFAACISFYGLVWQLTSGSKRADYWLLPLLMIFILAFIMAWSPVNIWRYLPEPLLVAQHCWRLLAQVIWIGALLFVWAVCWLFQNKLDNRHVIAITFMILVSTSSWFPKSQYSSVSLHEFMQKPSLIYNQEEFLINFNRYTSFVQQIDSVLLSPAAKLQLNHAYALPAALIDLAEQPYLQISGQSSQRQPAVITAVVNQKLLAERSFTTGDFTWNIPLTHDMTNTSAQPVLQFQSSQPQLAGDISLNQILLSGFLNPATVISTKESVPLCRQQRDMTICNIKANDTTQLIELPVIYYPELLRISINHQPAAYSSILSQGQLITTVRPTAKENLIEIQFAGLRSANLISLAAWIGWLLLLLFQIANYCKQIRVRI